MPSAGLGGWRHPVTKGLAGKVRVRRPRNTQPEQFHTPGYSWASPSGYALGLGKGKTPNATKTDQIVANF